MRLLIPVLMALLFLGMVGASNIFTVSPVSGNTYQNTNASALQLYITTSSTANTFLSDNSLLGYQVCNLGATLLGIGTTLNYNMSCTLTVPSGWNYTSYFGANTAFTGQYPYPVDVWNSDIAAISFALIGIGFAIVFKKIEWINMQPQGLLGQLVALPIGNLLLMLFLLAAAASLLIPYV